MASAKVNEVIQLLKNNQKVSEIYVPSLKRGVKFKHLTAGQQEQFVRALVDNPAHQSKFITTLINVIKENCEDKGLINQFTIIDRYAIGLGLRVASVGEVLKTEVEAEPGAVYNIDLKNNIEFIKSSLEHIPLDSITLDNIKIDLQYPTIAQEASNESYFRQNDSGLDTTPEAIRSIISNAFIGDVTMFVKAMTISREGSENIVIDFNQLTLQDKLDIIRRLPNTLLEKMLNPMSSVKTQIETILKSVGTLDTDPKIKRSVLIAFDASLFIASN